MLSRKCRMYWCVAVMEIAGYGLLAWHDWKTAVCIVLIHWGINLEWSADTREPDLNAMRQKYEEAASQLVFSIPKKPRSMFG